MKPILLFFIAVLFVSCGATDSNTADRSEAATTGVWQQGKQLFLGRCASCHMINKELAGPALRGVEGRWADKEKLYAFIRNSQEVVRSDNYARQLWLQYNQTIMTPHQDLTDAQIQQILGYINSVSEPSNP